MPAAHALLQASEDIERAAMVLSSAELVARPGGAASVAFHLKHLAGSLDRLLTYARGEALDVEQRTALKTEQVDSPSENAAPLVRNAQGAIASALDQLRATSEDTLQVARQVGRAALPTTVGGLLFHAAEHAVRHAGQIITTAKIVRGGG
jgi:uncharacterized damage-inducible protein DinB